MNILPVIVSAIIYFVIGAIWYSPKVFGKKWMELSNIKCEECKGMCQAYVGAFIIGLVISAVLAHFVHATHATTAFEGAKVGFFAWLGFGATIPFSAVLWERKPLNLYLIHTSCLLVAFLAIGALLAFWQ